MPTIKKYKIQYIVEVDIEVFHEDAKKNIAAVIRDTMCNNVIQYPTVGGSIQMVTIMPGKFITD